MRSSEKSENRVDQPDDSEVQTDILIVKEDDEKDSGKKYIMMCFHDGLFIKLKVAAVDDRQEINDTDRDVQQHEDGSISVRLIVGTIGHKEYEFIKEYDDINDGSCKNIVESYD